MPHIISSKLSLWALVNVLPNIINDCTTFHHWHMQLSQTLHLLGTSACPHRYWLPFTAEIFHRRK